MKALHFSLVSMSVIVASALAQAPPGTAGKPAPGQKIAVIFRPTRPFYDVTGPLEVAIRLRNNSTAPINTSGRLMLDDGIVVKDKAGVVVPKTDKVEREGRKLPATIDPKVVFDRTIDLRQGYPSLTGAGSYTVTWNDPRVSATLCTIRIAPAYDKSKDYSVTLETSMGDIVLEFYKDKAPNHVSNFVQLCRSGFYDGLTFHRVIGSSKEAPDGFMIQGGDPKGDGTGDAGYHLKGEFNDMKHEKGTLAMARSGPGTLGPDDQPNSASCQFYICLAPQAKLDGKYTVFGHVVSGMDVVEKIGKVKTSGPPNDRPLEPVAIKKATAVEKASASPATAPPASAPSTTGTPPSAPPAKTGRQPAAPKKGA